MAAKITWTHTSRPAERIGKKGGPSEASSFLLFRLLFAQHDILFLVAKWCTVTVTEPDGRRHSLDVQATSTFDAAHLYIVEAKKERAVGLPKLTLTTVFEVVTDGKVYRVKGEALQKWIVERRQKWQGPKGYMFTKRPGLV
jgi:hypothetical protein